MINNFFFWGSDEFSVSVLDQLIILDQQPELIITTPDQPRGRGRLLKTPAVKHWAELKKIPYCQPIDWQTLPADFKPHQLSLLASYGKIIPPKILGLPVHGMLNLHPSLLPKYRGASPIQSAILQNEKKTGITLMKMDEQLDHGPILGIEKYDLTGKSFIQTRVDLAKLGAQLFVKLLPDYLVGKLKPIEQNHSQATYTKKIKKEDGLINFHDKPEVNYRKFLALSPWPGTYFFRDPTDRESRVIIIDANLNEQGEFVIKKVKPAGRHEISWEDYQRGFARP